MSGGMFDLYNQKIIELSDRLHRWKNALIYVGLYALILTGIVIWYLFGSGPWTKDDYQALQDSLSVTQERTEKIISYQDSIIASETTLEAIDSYNESGFNNSVIKYRDVIKEIPKHTEDEDVDFMDAAVSNYSAVRLPDNITHYRTGNDPFIDSLFKQSLADSLRRDSIRRGIIESTGGMD